MQKALPIAFAVLGGILLGRVQLSTNHEANDAIAGQAHAERQLAEARADARAARARLVKLEQQFVGVWQRLDGALGDYASAGTVVDREVARQRIEQLRWDMDVVDARLVASRRPVHITGWRKSRE